MLLRALYVWNAALLVAHEVDAAHWREWELFRLPGGEGAFVAIHVVLAAAVLWGYGRLAAGAESGLVASIVLAAAGALATAIHGGLLAAGRPEFRTPASLAVLAATGVLSVLQASLAAGTLAGERRVRA
jgi:hypothetical protein